MAAELKREFGIRSTWSVGRRTGFYVLLNGETVFSAAGRDGLPGPGEVSARIRALDSDWRARPQDGPDAAAPSEGDASETE